MKETVNNVFAHMLNGDSNMLLFVASTLFVFTVHVFVEFYADYNFPQNNVHLALKFILSLILFGSLFRSLLPSFLIGSFSSIFSCSFCPYSFWPFYCLSFNLRFLLPLCLLQTFKVNGDPPHFAGFLLLFLLIRMFSSQSSLFLYHKQSYHHSTVIRNIYCASLHHSCCFVY